MIHTTTENDRAYAEALTVGGLPLAVEEKRKAFYEAICGLSPMLLDHLGITINVGDLPTAAYYRYCQGRMYGTGRLSRFWFRWIRPGLAPKRQEGIERAHYEAQNRFRREFLSAILERGDK